MSLLRKNLVLALVGLGSAPAGLGAQAALDPRVAPQAALLARQGRRPEAVEFLGRYLATAPDDGLAWLQLGRLYLLDSRDWHRSHEGDPSGALLLDFAATAADQAHRASGDSAALLRAAIEADRALLVLEARGWRVTRAGVGIPPEAEPPAYVTEMGRNLMNSCPLDGVLVTGAEVEEVGIWTALLVTGDRPDLVLLQPRWYEADPEYRGRIAEVTGLDAALPLRDALADLADRRPICLTPGMDAAFRPDRPLAAVRLVRVAGAVSPAATDPLAIRALVAAVNYHPDPVSTEVLALYTRAARHNQRLCATLLSPFGAGQRAVCGR